MLLSLLFYKRNDPNRSCLQTAYEKKNSCPKITDLMVLKAQTMKKFLREKWLDIFFSMDQTRIATDKLNPDSFVLKTTERSQFALPSPLPKLHLDQRIPFRGKMTLYCKYFNNNCNGSMRSNLPSAESD